MIPGSGEASRGLGEAVLWVTGAGGAAWSTAQRSGASRADGSASGRHGGEDGSDPWGHGVSEREAGAHWQAGPCGATRGKVWAGAGLTWAAGFLLGWFVLPSRGERERRAGLGFGVLPFFFYF